MSESLREQISFKPHGASPISYTIRSSHENQAPTTEFTCPPTQTHLFFTHYPQFTQDLCNFPGISLHFEAHAFVHFAWMVHFTILGLKVKCRLLYETFPEGTVDHCHPSVPSLPPCLQIRFNETRKDSGLTLPGIKTASPGHTENIDISEIHQVAQPFQP